MNEIDLAYIAGIFDGEGNIGIVKRGKMNGRTVPIYHLVVRVGMCDEDIPKLLHKTFGGYLEHRKRPNPKHRDIYTWSMAYGKAVDFLTQILPYLKLKKEQAELAIKFQNGKVRGGGEIGKHGNVFKTEEELAIEESQYILMRDLKH